MEVWKDVVDSNGFYKVSNIGNVKRCKKMQYSQGKMFVINKEHLLTPVETKDGYLRVKVLKNNKLKACLVSRLVAEAFIPNPNQLEQIDHINRDKKDNRFENLRWVTNKVNCNNKTNNKILTYNNISMTVSQWADVTKIPLTTILQRLRYGWDIKRVLTEPVNTKYRKRSYADGN